MPALRPSEQSVTLQPVFANHKNGFRHKRGLKPNAERNVLPGSVPRPPGRQGQGDYDRGSARRLRGYRIRDLRGRALALLHHPRRIR